MSKDRIRKIHLMYGCVTAVLVLIMAVALIVSCIGIYQSGERPFSREAVSGALGRIAVPGYLCLVAVLGAIALHIALPLEPEKSKAIRSDYDTLCRYAQKYGALPADARKRVDKEVKFRRTGKVITTVVSVLLAAYPVIYFADASHFGVADLNGDILQAVLTALIPTALALILVYLCGVVNARSTQRQISIYKDSAVKPDKVSHEDRTHPKVLLALRCVLVVAAVVLIIMGIANDGVADVLGKAIRICTECIGLG